MMLAHLLGTLATLATFGLVGIALLVALLSYVRGGRSTALRALALAGVVVTLYGLGIALPALLAPTKVLAPSEELSFCGFDCHLHVAVVAAESDPAGPRVLVGIQVRSDAIQAPEHPSLLRIRLVDRAGREYAPEPMPDGRDPFAQVLEAGDSYSRTLSFPAPASEDLHGLRVTWRVGLDYWVLGPGNTFLKRKTLLALPAQPD
jgi:hypothetical protein